MNTDKAMILYDAVTGVREDYIEDAGSDEARKPFPLRQLSLIAACLCLAVGIAYAAIFLSGAPGLPSGGGAGAGGGEGSVYSYYAGPVLPLTAEDGTGLTAERSVDYDFSLFAPGSDLSYAAGGSLRYGESCLVTDRYLLTNSASEARSLTLYYPFMAALTDEALLLPTLTLGGKAAEAELLIGPGRSSGGRILLSSWEDCRELMEGDCLSRALAALPELGEKVIVYVLSEFWGERSEEAPNPEAVLEFTMDPGKSALLSFGFNGGSNDRESGRYARMARIPQPGEWGYGHPVYLLVLGADLESWTLQAYTNGACETTMENAGATVTRYETTLGEALALCWEGYRAEYLADKLASLIDTETLLGLTGEWLLQRDALQGSSVPYEQSSNGLLEDVFNYVLAMDRVMYLRFTLDLPAGETAEIEAKLLKYPSVDHGGKERYRRGFDLATRLGSPIAFTKQEASLSAVEYITILRQDFGFDLKNGVLRVNLDPEKEHYFLEVEAKKLN